MVMKTEISKIKILEEELEKAHKEIEYWKKMFHKVNAYLIKK
jgi:hypothetical protein